MAHRFFCLLENISADKITLSDKKQLHHLKDVLRLEPGDEAVIFDEQGREYLCQIEKISAGGAALKIKDCRDNAPARKYRLTIACAIPKNSKFDDIIDKLTQLGVDRIIPLLSERVVVRPVKARAQRRLERWQKVALSAAKQSQRRLLPVIEPITGIKQLFSRADNFGLKLIPALIGKRKTLHQAFFLCKEKGSDILVLIGPEGDFTPRELKLAEKAGFIPVSLGDLVLRVETAAVAVAGFIRLYEND